MTIKALTLLAASVATVTLIAQQTPRQPEFNLGNGELVISNITKLGAISNDGENVEFDFSGNPVRGRYATFGFRFQAQQVTGKAQLQQQGGAFVNSLNMTGNVVFQRPHVGEQIVSTLRTSRVIYAASSPEASRLTLPNAFTLESSETGATVNLAADQGSMLLRSVNGQAPSMTQVVLDRGANIKTRQVQRRQGRAETTVNQEAVSSGKITLDQIGSGNSSQSKVTFASAFTFTSDSTGGQQQKMVLKGSRGEFLLADITKSVSEGSALKTANITGPVTATIVGVNSRREPVDIKVSGSNLAYSGNILRLSGDIAFTYTVGTETQPIVYNGVGSSDVIEVTLGEDGEIKGWKVSGGPARVEGQQGGGQ